MDKKQIVANVIPAQGEEGLTFQEICSKVTGVAEDEVQSILDRLYKSMKIETIRFSESVLKYRCAKGVEL